MRRLAEVPVARTGTVDDDAVAEAGCVELRAEDGLGHRRTADVACAHDADAYDICHRSILAPRRRPERPNAGSSCPRCGSGTDRVGTWRATGPSLDSAAVVADGPGSRGGGPMRMGGSWFGMARLGYGIFRRSQREKARAERQAEKDARREEKERDGRSAESSEMPTAPGVTAMPHRHRRPHRRPPQPPPVHHPTTRLGRLRRPSPPPAQRPPQPRPPRRLPSQRPAHQPRLPSPSRLTQPTARVPAVPATADAADPAETAFVLGGGGVLGANEVGMLQALARGRDLAGSRRRHQRRRGQRRGRSRAIRPLAPSSA